MTHKIRILPSFSALLIIYEIKLRPILDLSFYWSKRFLTELKSKIQYLTVIFGPVQTNLDNFNLSKANWTVPKKDFGPIEQ